MAMSRDEFRAKVTSDASFREELKKDPVAVLRSIGWDAPESPVLSDDDLGMAQGGTIPPSQIAPPQV